MIFDFGFSIFDFQSDLNNIVMPFSKSKIENPKSKMEVPS